MIVGYAFVVADLFHYGHLNFLRECKKYCDYLIVGVYTDELTMTYKRRPIIPYEERIAIVASIKEVDKVIKVTDRSCVPALKHLAKEGYVISHLFHGTDWNADKDPDLKVSMEYMKSIGGDLVQPAYYESRSTTSIIKDIIKRFKTGDLDQKVLKD